MATSIKIPPPVTDTGAPLPSQGSLDFGPNVLIFDPSSSDIQLQVDNVFATQESNQFGPERYAIFFKPGFYDLNVQVGFYTTVIGLGTIPDSVTITGGVNTTAAWFQGNATQNFWRGIENLAVVPTVFGDSGMMFATSQSTWLRRLHVRGTLQLYDFIPRQGPNWSSGGFIADSVIDNTTKSGSQQQYLLRNSNPTNWQGQSFNMVFVGDYNAPGGTWSNQRYTVVANTPVVREKPYLVVDDSNNYSVIVPALKHNSQGPSWENGADTTSTSLPLSMFYVAQASKDDATTLNIALQRNMHLLLTPGVYNLSQPIVIRNPNTVVLGIGLATLSPTQGTPAIMVADVSGVTIAGLLLDAGTSNSPNLLQLGDVNVSTVDHSANPTAVFDVCCRIGGAASRASATSCVVVNSRNVIIDQIWLWRADHGGPGIPTGWTINPCINGIVVNSDNVTIYGLFVEHFQGFQTLWNGNSGSVYFYQSEEPYDVPNQESWKQNGENGFPSYKISDKVTTHITTGLGIYCNFNNPVQLYNAIESPPAPNISMHHFLTFWLNGDSRSAINHLVNGGGNQVDQNHRLSASTA